MNFSEALDCLKIGLRMQRVIWARDTFVFFVPGSEFKANRYPLNQWFPGEEITYSPHLDMCIDRNVLVWQPQTIDILSRDWEIYAET